MSLASTKSMPELLARYNKPGPRYTSYPTAVEFHDGVGEAAYRDSLARADACPTSRCRSTCTCPSARSAAPTAAASW